MLPQNFAHCKHLFSLKTLFRKFLAPLLVNLNLSLPKYLRIRVLGVNLFFSFQNTSEFVCAERLTARGVRAEAMGGGFLVRQHGTNLANSKKRTENAGK